MLAGQYRKTRNTSSFIVPSHTTNACATCPRMGSRTHYIKFSTARRDAWGCYASWRRRTSVLSHVVHGNQADSRKEKDWSTWRLRILVGLGSYWPYINLSYCTHPTPTDRHHTHTQHGS